MNLYIYIRMSIYMYTEAVDIREKYYNIFNFQFVSCHRPASPQLNVYMYKNIIIFLFANCSRFRFLIFIFHLLIRYRNMIRIVLSVYIYYS